MHSLRNASLEMGFLVDWEYWLYMGMISSVDLFFVIWINRMRVWLILLLKSSVIFDVKWIDRDGM